MKTIISEDEEKIVYQFSFEGNSKESIYFKKGFIFHQDQQVDFDAIAENDLQNWMKSILDLT